jgi:GNAT superfamily N-acetyltransferase
LDELNYHEIVTLEDPRYDDYLDLYQKSFPLGEQGLVSEHNRMLRARMRGEEVRDHLLVAVSRQGDTIGMARYMPASNAPAGVLWYLAVQPGRRGAGIGSAIYAEVIRRIRVEAPTAVAVLFEVESPEHCRSREDAEAAARRIRFYQRSGARLLGGVRYSQSVGWQPPMEMCLMVHPLETMDAAAAYRICSLVFGDSVVPVDAPTLDGLG